MVSDEKKQRVTLIIIAYPFVLALIGLLLNFFVFGVNSISVALPTEQGIWALTLAAVLLVINHAWLMTSTELTRLKYGLYATSEEWEKSKTSKDDASSQGLREVERRHNAHRNTTENVIYFALVSFIFVLVSPTLLATMLWMVGFAVSRLGYTFSYLKGNDDLRGIFMSVSLLSMFGMVSYLVLAGFS